MLEFQMYFILKDKEVVPVKDVIEWATQHEKVNKVIKQTDIRNYFISTIFLGINYNLFGDKPVVFETMIFKDEKSFCVKRWSTYQEAEDGHEEACEKVINEFL